eukprot:scaffold22607_cov123-Cylindrotheca_fusiformis.AAC.3
MSFSLHAAIQLQYNCDQLCEVQDIFAALYASSSVQNVANPGYLKVGIRVTKVGNIQQQDCQTSMTTRVNYTYCFE